jgi:hypothetical protein
MLPWNIQNTAAYCKRVMVLYTHDAGTRGDGNIQDRVMRISRISEKRVMGVSKI